MYFSHTNQSGTDLKIIIRNFTYQNYLFPIFYVTHALFKKKPPNNITGIIKVGANAKATCKFGAKQDII